MDKPNCYGKYSETFPKQGRACRACFCAVDCKNNNENDSKNLDNGLDFEKPTDKMNVKELKDYCETNEYEIPEGVTSKKEIRAFIELQENGNKDLIDSENESEDEE